MDQEDHSVKPAWASTEQKGLASVKPEFKPQYCQKKKKGNSKKYEEMATNM
jgi:hypothetical protein